MLNISKPCNHQMLILWYPDRQVKLSFCHFLYLTYFFKPILFIGRLYMAEVGLSKHINRIFVAKWLLIR